MMRRVRMFGVSTLTVAVKRSDYSGWLTDAISGYATPDFNWLYFIVVCGYPKSRVGPQEVGRERLACESISATYDCSESRKFWTARKFWAIRDSIGDCGGLRVPRVSTRNCGRFESRNNIFLVYRVAYYFIISSCSRANGDFSGNS